MMVSANRKLYLIICLIAVTGICCTKAFGQTPVPKNWHLLDLETDSVYGTGIERAYRELLADRRGDSVIVAIIDTGLDTDHEDLKGVLWHNPGEHGNDEDNNGYQGDIHGWNFLGDLKKEGMEYKRIYALWHSRFKGKNLDDIQKRHREQYRMWKAAAAKVEEDSLSKLNFQRDVWQSCLELEPKIRALVDKEQYTTQEMREVLEETKVSFTYKGTPFYSMFLSSGMSNLDFLEQQKLFLQNVENFCYYCSYTKNREERREVRGTNENDFKDPYYGNNDLSDLRDHGTHVAGIIGAQRNNGIGIDGVADRVKLMGIRVNSRGDEQDKDVVMAIRYAVDNGAKVINMSFGKRYYSPHRKEVEKAIRYALKKDVLVVHAAGNYGQNIDSVAYYPASDYLKKRKGRFPNMIVVGASGPKKDNLALFFSNYGSEMVDVFAPGGDIYSSIPMTMGKYKKQSGTSMATPVVSGVAAVLRSYFPELSAREVKKIIEESVTPVEFKVTKPSLDKDVPKEKVSMKALCKTGGIVNAYKAIQQAEAISKK